MSFRSSASLTDEADVKRLVSETVSGLGRIDMWSTSPAA